MISPALLVIILFILSIFLAIPYVVTEIMKEKKKEDEINETPKRIEIVIKKEGDPIHTDYFIE